MKLKIGLKRIKKEVWVSVRTLQASVILSKVRSLTIFKIQKFSGFAKLNFLTLKTRLYGKARKNGKGKTGGQRVVLHYRQT